MKYFVSPRRIFLAVLTTVMLTTFSLPLHASDRIERPIDGGVVNQTHLYGELYNGYRHRGLDFSYATGTTVKAAYSGWVVQYKETTWDNTYVQGEPWGNFVLIQHDRRHYDATTDTWGYVYSFYMHLKYNSVVVSEDQYVYAGQNIAQVNGTGNVDGPHLHYQVVVHPNEDTKLASLGAENRSRNPELWLTPFDSSDQDTDPNTVTVVGRLSDANGNPIAGKHIVGLEKPSGAGGTCPGGLYGFSLTYAAAVMNPDDLLQENFATTDVAPGSYAITAYDGYNLGTCQGTGGSTSMGTYSFPDAGRTYYVGLHPVFVPDLRYNGDGIRSTLTIRNNSSSKKAKVTTSFIDANGDVEESRTDSLNENGNVTFDAPSSMGTGGSALIVGTEDISVVVLQSRSSPNAMDSYSGIDEPATEVIVPIVQNNNSGWRSDIFIQNASNASNNVMLEFRQANDTDPECGASILNMRPWTRYKVDVDTLQCTSAILSARIFSTSNAPIAVSSTQYHGDPIAQFMETGTSGLATLAIYAPLIQHRAPNPPANWRSGLGLVTTSGAANMAYYDASGGAACDSDSESSIPYAVPKIIHPVPPAGSSCAYGAISAVLSFVRGANVNQIHDTTPVATTYRAITSPSRTVNIARLAGQFHGWNDAFVVQNTSNNSTAVTVTFYNSDGTLNSTQPRTLTGRETWTVFAPSFGGNGIGSAKITSANQSIAVAVNNYRSSQGGDNLGSFAADH